MANNPDDFYEEPYFKSPTNAVKSFGFDEPAWGSKGAAGKTLAPPRPKFLFMVRFVRGVGEGGPSWANGVPIAVKKMDRPTIIPQITTMNQYNKKRLVQTGVKYETVNIDFHDTADSMVNYLWYEYANHYYGDYRRTNDFDWGYDQTGEFRNTGGMGFGATIPTAGSPDAPGSLEAGNFFKKIECYQFFGAHYVQYDLINPKITRFDPDDFDYEANNSHSIRMSIDYEAVVVQNAFMPLPIVTNPELVELLGGTVEGNYVKGGVLDGEVFTPPDAMDQSFFRTQIPGLGSVSSIAGDLAQKFGINYSAKYGLLGNSIGGALEKVGTVASIINTANSAIGGLGNFDFGKVGSTITGGINTGNIASSLGNLGKIASGSISQSAYDLASAAKKSGSSMLSSLTGSQPSSSFSLGVSNALRGPTSSVGLRKDSISSVFDSWL